MNNGSSPTWLPHKERYLEILGSPMWKLITDIHDGLLRDSVSYWGGRGTKYVQLPITTHTISSPMGLGSGSLPVSVDLFGIQTYLADSMQFMLEYGCRLSANGTWYIMPSFRGESADETHLNQFFHSEAEIPGTLPDVISTVEDYLRTITAGAVARIKGSELSSRYDIAHLTSFLTGTAVPQITFAEAYRYLAGDDDLVRETDGVRSITRRGERQLLTDISPILWVTHYDHNSVPFYQAYADDDQRIAACGDLLFGIGEVVGAGARHTTGDDVAAALQQHEVIAEPYQWYVDMKRNFPLATAGFGLGVERWLQWILSVSDIRDLQLVPRLNGIELQP